MKHQYVLEDEFSFDIRVIGGTSLLAAFLTGIIGNLMVIFMTILILQKKKNVPNALILILAGVDFLSLLATYVQPLVTYVNGRFKGGDLVCNINASMIVFTNMVSILVVVGMMYDRWLAVSKPYCYKEKLTYSKQKLCTFIIFTCILSLLITLPVMLPFGANELYYPGTFCMFSLKTENTHDQVILTFYVVVFSAMFLLIIFASTSGCIFAYQMFSQRSRFLPASHLKSSEEYLFIRLSLITMTLFLVLWLPLYVILCLSLSNIHYPRWSRLLAAHCTALHSVVNPWLHPTLRRKFRRCFGWFFQVSLSHVTCGCVTKPKGTLESVLLNENENTTQAEENMRELNDITAGNTMFNMAQINIFDHVDGAQPHMAADVECDVEMEPSMEFTSQRKENESVDD